MADPDLQIKGGGGGGGAGIQTLRQGGARPPKTYFHFGLKISGEPQAPRALPLDPPLTLLIRNLKTVLNEKFFLQVN